MCKSDGFRESAQPILRTTGNKSLLAITLANIVARMERSEIREAAGAAGIRHSPRPLWADDSAKPRAHRAAGFTRTSREMVIASGAKQSISPRKERMDCFAALAMTVWLFEI